MTDAQLRERARAFRESFEMDYLGGPMFGLTGDALESAAEVFDARLAALLAAVAREAEERMRLDQAHAEAYEEDLARDEARHDVLHARLTEAHRAESAAVASEVEERTIERCAAALGDPNNPLANDVMRMATIIRAMPREE